MALPSPVRRGHRVAVFSAAAFCVILILAALLLAFGWPLMRGLAERRLAASIDRPVRIGALHRIGGGLFTPLLRLDDLTIAQPAWAGQGDMLRIAELRIRLPLAHMVSGRGKAEAVAIRGLRVALVTDASGRHNWRSGQKDDASSRGSSLDIGRMVVSDAQGALDDAKRDRHLTARFAIDPTAFRLIGSGTIAGSPARLAITGAGVAGQRHWPFRAMLTSAAVSLKAEGHAATPLDFGHFTARVRSSGHGLQDLDRVIEAGLFKTQPYRLAATIIHEDPNWQISGLKGRLGRSDIAADLRIDKHDGRTFIAGKVLSNGFDFDDLASDEGLAESAAKARRVGPRLFPNTRINLAKLGQLDGDVHFDLRRLLFKTPSAFRSVSGTATLSHRVLTISPLIASVGGGRVTGSAIVRHQTGAPLLLADLTMTGARMEQLFTDPGTATGALAGRARLQGRGETVRAAAGHFTGMIGLAGRNGAIDRRAALVAGSDVGRALTAGGEDKTAMRCLVARFRVADGVARPEILLLDTGVGRADGSGSVDLATERLDLSLSGHAKLGGGLKLDQPIRVQGIIKRPEIIAPPRATTVKGVLGMIGRAISGKTPPTVGDANCAVLTARALR